MDPEKAEQQIACGLRDGQTDAWRSLYDAYARQVWCVVARQMGPDAADVADVVQETFLAAARSARQYDSARGSLWMWLCGIARRHVALHFRSRQRHERLREKSTALTAQGQQTIHWLESPDPGPGEMLAQKELAGLVRTVLAELPLDYEMLLAAKYFEGISDDELAGQEACSSDAIRSKLARARRAFRESVPQKGIPMSGNDDNWNEETAGALFAAACGRRSRAGRRVPSAVCARSPPPCLRHPKSPNPSGDRKCFFTLSRIAATAAAASIAVAAWFFAAGPAAQSRHTSARHWTNWRPSARSTMRVMLRRQGDRSLGQAAGAVALELVRRHLPDRPRRSLVAGR